MFDQLGGVIAELGVWPVLAACAIYFLGGFAKGAVGFALPLITVSLLPFVLPVEVALAVNAAILPAMNVYQSAQSGNYLEPPRRFWPMFVGIAAGVPVGAALISSVEPETMILFIGTFVTLFSAYLMINPRLRIPPRAEKPAAGIAGLLAGTIGAMATTHGPVFVTFLVGVGAERRLMMAALAQFFLISGILIAGSFFFVGILTGDRLLLALLCAVPAGIGQWLGNRLADLVPAQRFRRIVLGALFILGINMVIRTLMA